MPPPDGPLPPTEVRRPSDDERAGRRVLRNVNVVDVRAGVVRERQDVLIADGRIQRVGKRLEATERIDLTTLLLTIGLGVLTGLVFGAVGAIQSARHSTHESLKAGTLSTSVTAGKFGKTTLRTGPPPRERSVTVTFPTGGFCAGR